MAIFRKCIVSSDNQTADIHEKVFLVTNTINTLTEILNHEKHSLQVKRNDILQCIPTLFGDEIQYCNILALLYCYYELQNPTKFHLPLIDY